MTNTKEISNLVNSFDYHYEMSDDPNTYYYGRISEKKIHTLLSELTRGELRKVKAMISIPMEAINLYFKKYFENIEPEPTKKALPITSPIRSKVFKTAWTIFKSGFAVSFGEALKKAWVIIKISLGRGTSISFAKSTGEIREAKAIQIGSIRKSLECGVIRYLEEINGSIQWRSFRVERLLVA